MKNGRRYRIKPKFFVILFLMIAAAVVIVLLAKSCDRGGGGTIHDISLGTAAPSETESGTDSTLEPTEAPTPMPVAIDNPYSVDSTSPEAFGLHFDMELDGEDIEEYHSAFTTYFGDDFKYAPSVRGVTTFRGNNFRDDATYGSAGSVTNKTLELVWTQDIPGSIEKGTGSGSWFGVGWTGQPLIVEWDKSTVDMMNIYEAKKAKEGLVEVVYATEASYIYFFDLEDGSFTRDKIRGGWTFKGSGAIDPRGYPLLYVGAGDNGPNGAAKNFIFSLIDGSELYTYGAKDEYSLRSFKGFDAATIVDAETDSVTYASETGIIYRFKLNTNFDRENGTISVSPDNILKWRYTTDRTRTGGSSKYWLGFEASPIIWRNYMYVADNAGNLFCIDVNTMKVIWMQDVLDDTNCTPIFELDKETGEAFIYIGTSSHWTADSNEIAQIPFWKINAITGEIIWKDNGYRCTRTNVSGGIQASPADGKNNVSDLVFVSYAMTVDTETMGTLVAYDKQTGEKVWVKQLKRYSYSSPIVLYDDNGDGYIVTFDSSGTAYLFDARTGELYSTLELEGNFEGSPAAFGNMIVIGTRASKVYGIKLS